MESKIMQIFYGNDCLPYKDKNRVVHYPIIGSAFQGASQTTEIRFYIDRIGGNNATWVAVSKLPNGKVGTKILEGSYDYELNENYVTLQLSSFYTQAKGDLYVSLQGYDGGVQVEYNSETEIYDVVGTPTIQATGSVKIAINYATQFVGSDENEQITVQEALALVSGKLDKTQGIIVVNDIIQVVATNYDNGQMLYDIATKSLYRKENGTIREFFSSYDKDEIDLKLADKLDKITTSGEHAYIHNGSTQSEISISESAAGGSIPKRTSTGNVYVGLTPSNNGHASSKKYVDDSISSARNFLLTKINDAGHFLGLVESTDPSKEYDYIIQLKDKAGNVISSVELDLPLESIITNGSYDSTTKEIVLTLDNGAEVRIPVGDLVEGLVDEQGLQVALQPYIKELGVSSVLTTNDLLQEIGVGKNFVLDNMGDILLCYISEDSGTYTLSIVGKDKAYHSTFNENTLVINLLSNTTLDIDYLPIIELSTLMQTLSSSQMQIANQDNSVIKYSDRLYHKCNVGESTIEFVSVDYDIVDEGANQKLTKYEITVNKTTGATNMITSYVSFYSSGEIDAKLEEYAKVDGNYPTMTVGNADALTPYGENSGVKDTTPFLLQSTGGNSDVSYFAYLRALRGNTVNWKQLARPITSDWYFDDAGLDFEEGKAIITLDSNGSMASQTRGRLLGITNQNTIEVINGHKYLTRIVVSVDAQITTQFKISNANDEMVFYNPYGLELITMDANKNYVFEQIRTATQNSNSNPHYTLANYTFVDGTKLTYHSLQIFDLTAIFGIGNEPTSVEEFNRLFPKPYYEYNNSELLSSKSSKIVNIGYNQFDGELEQGAFDEATGLPVSYETPNAIISSNLTKVIQGQKYTFESINRPFTNGLYAFLFDANKTYIKRQYIAASTTTNYESVSAEFIIPEGVVYINIGLQNNNDIASISPIGAKLCFHLTWDGSRTGYEPYEKHEYNLPNIELRSAGNVYDELKPDGILIRRVGYSSNMASLTWELINESIGLYRTTIRDLKSAVGQQDRYTNINSSVYPVSNAFNSFGDMTDKSISRYSNHWLYIKDSSIASVNELLTKLANAQLVYELDTPTEEQVSGFQELQQIDDFGTQEFVSEEAIPVPQGNEFFYPVDYKAFIDSLGGREDIGYDASKVVSEEQLTEATKIEVIELNTEISSSSSTSISSQDRLKIANLVQNPFNKLLKFKVDGVWYTTKTFWWYDESRIQAVFMKYGARASVLYLSNGAFYVENRMF